MPACDRPETCPPPPPHAPPVADAQLQAATRARYEAEARARQEAQVRARVAAEIDGQRQARWVDRGRVPERDPVPLRWPLVQLGLVGGGDPGLTEHRGASTPLLTGIAFARFVPEPRWALDVGGGIATLAPEHEARYRAVTVQSGVSATLSNFGEGVHTAVVLGRAGLELGLPFEGGTRTPRAFIGVKLSVETDLFAAHFGDGGFVAAALDLGLAVRVPIGGESDAARLVTIGPQILIGPTVAF